MNPKVVAVEPSVIRAINARKKASTIDLGLGEPTLGPTMAFFEAATRSVAEHGIKYTANAGATVLREAIVRHYGYRYLDDPAGVCITTGSQEAVYVAIKAVLDPLEDELLIVEPAFPVYAKIAQLEGISVTRVQLVGEGFGFNVERILAGLTPRTRMVAVCSPCNPTGRVMRAQDARRLALGLRAHREQHGKPVYVLHDEIYRELMYVEEPGYFGTEYEYTIAVNSLSKSNAVTGLRLGWVAAPVSVAAEILKAHTYVTSCASTYAQYVAAAIFRAGALGEHAQWYKTQRTKVLAALGESGLEFVVPEGGFYACVKLRDGTNSVAFAQHLIEHADVAAIPGVIFGESLEGWLRLSWVTSAERFREGLRRIVAVAAPAKKS